MNNQIPRTPEHLVINVKQLGNWAVDQFKKIEGKTDPRHFKGWWWRVGDGRHSNSNSWLSQVAVDTINSLLREKGFEFGQTVLVEYEREIKFPGRNTEGNII